LDRIKAESAKNYGRLYNEVMKETRGRYFSSDHKELLVKEFEPI
jgi:hypothetical protein